MKVITLLPVKNEAWILDYSLKNFSDFSDHIIVADQKSTDGSREIYNKYPKVSVIENNNIGHSNQIRWKLLEEARKIEGYNLIFCIDADEMVSPNAVDDIKNIIKDRKPGIWFELPWIQLWKRVDQFRNDGVWRNNYKVCGFYDDRKMEYEKKFVINDHTTRVPGPAKETIKVKYPLLHFQFVAWERNMIKQIWYKCSEFILNPKLAKRINMKYSHALENPELVTETTQKEWFDKITPISENALNKNDEQYTKQIYEWFDKYGIEYFEPLDIWYIKKFRDIFISKIGREPKCKKYPYILIKINNIKNSLKKYL